MELHAPYTLRHARNQSRNDSLFLLSMRIGHNGFFFSFESVRANALMLTPRVREGRGLIDVVVV